MSFLVINELRLQVSGETGRIRVIALVEAFYFLAGHSADKLINVQKFAFLENDERRRERSGMKQWSMPGKDVRSRQYFGLIKDAPHWRE